MTRRLLILSFAALATAGCTFTEAPKAEADMAKVCSPPSDQQTLIEDVLALVNEARVAEDLNPLVLDPTLSEVADAYACEMIAGDFFAHEDPRTGTGASRRLTAAGYVFYAMGENLAVGQTSAEDVVAAWLASPEHRANILDPNWREVGIAVRNGGDYGWYWVQEFADPVEFGQADGIDEAEPAAADATTALSATAEDKAPAEADAATAASADAASTQIHQLH